MNYRKEIEHLGWKKAEHKKEMTALYEVSKKESRAFNEDEQVKFDELKANCKVIDGQIDVAHELMRNEEQDSEIVTDANQVVHEQAAEIKEPDKFASFGEQLIAVANAQPGRLADPRFSAATGLSEGVASDGGFLVQTDFVSDLMTPIFEGGNVASRVRRIPISANANGVTLNAVDETSRVTGSRWGGIQGFWLNEAGTKTKSKPKFRQIELNLKKLIGLAWATDELLQDAAALGSVITQGFQDEFTFLIEDAIINGTGAGQPKGIMATGPMVQVNKETGQSAATIVAENIEKMYSRMHARSLPNAVWYINQDVWPQIFQLHHAVGTGGVSMFIPAGALSQGPAGTLLGRPIIPIEYCQTLGTAGDIIFADMSQYLLADKGGTQSASSIHVNFTSDETVFRFVVRVDGQPSWVSALTPFKGGATQSPFIRLQTRS